MKRYLLLAILFFPFGILSAQQNVIDKIVAIVGEEIILKSDIENAYLQDQGRGIASSSSDYRAGLLENLLVQKLLMAQAQVDSVSVTEDQVESAVESQIDYFISNIGSQEKLENYFGKSIEEIKDDMREPLRDDQLLWIAFAYLIFGLGQNLINNFNLYYFIYVLGDSTQFSFLGVINVVIGLMAVALFPTLTKKFSRRKLFFISITIMLIAIVVYYMAGQNVYMTLLGAGLFALPQPLIFLVVLMTITDSVEYGQLKLGHRDEALVLCVRPLIDKLGGAITSAIVGFTAVWVGMSGKATAASITPENLLNFQLIMFAAPFILIVIAGFIYRAKVSLTEEKHAEIVRELERTWGKDNK